MSYGSDAGCWAEVPRLLVDVRPVEADDGVDDEEEEEEAVEPDSEDEGRERLL